MRFALKEDSDHLLQVTCVDLDLAAQFRLQMQFQNAEEVSKLFIKLNIICHITNAPGERIMCNYSLTKAKYEVNISKYEDIIFYIE